MIVDCSSPTMIGGSALPIRICQGTSGVTRSWSNVPCSRSLATEKAAVMSVCSMASAAISPTRIVQRESRFSLNQALTCTATAPPEPRSCAPNRAAIDAM